MQHLIDFVGSLVIAASAMALAHFGVTLRDGAGCPQTRDMPVVQRLPAASGRLRPTRTVERDPARVRIVFTLV